MMAIARRILLDELAQGNILTLLSTEAVEIRDEGVVVSGGCKKQMGLIYLMRIVV
jgi:hypothetical protein